MEDEIEKAGKAIDSPEAEKRIEIAGNAVDDLAAEMEEKTEKEGVFDSIVLRSSPNTLY